MGDRDGSDATRGGGEGSRARQSGNKSPSRPGLTLSLPSGERSAGPPPELPRRDDSRKLAWRDDGTLRREAMRASATESNDHKMMQVYEHA